jgi:hypothetical protein
VTRGSVVEGRARSLPAPVFIDLTGRDRVRRIAMASAALAALIVFANSLANGFVLDDRELTIARHLFPRDSLVYHVAADLAERRQRPVAAEALRDSARIARTIPYGSTSFRSGARP